MLFDDIANLIRTLVLGVCSYGSLIVALHLSGKRTLAKLNAFDLVVTVALGSTLATILLSKDVTLAQGALALVSLVLLQYVIAWLSVRFDTIERLAKSEPAVLLRDGKIIDDALRRERVTVDEIKAALRGEGLGDFQLAALVVLETDGSLSVVPKSSAGSRSTFPSPVQ
ncbi:DUF421 domain-containing protein [Aurantiacibacter xanthus]|uniref:DUF421 domain-containing protein n=1 Tax=Aurantiacibacter xanthus TaxID=1784712 RepID=A0A3A1PG36_9SPHN|nr:YetF domain-containing protein [Aurantiacibacter xanthus]RIV92761.1 DUF421 domain-containing protein [Aurantiacibacter xanthus]